MQSAQRILIAVVVCAVAGFATVDHNPRSAGTSQTRNATGSAYEATYHNPALLGVERSPKGGLLLAPITNYGFGVWSDKLAIRPYRAFFNPGDVSSEEWGKIVADVFDRSFKLEGLSPSEASEALTEKLRGGVRVYAGARASLLSFAQNHLAVDVTTRLDEEARIPEGPLFMLFSETEGLQRGKTLDFSGLRQEAIWATDVSLHLGLPVSIPALHDIFKLRYGAGGVGIKYVMGHSILRTQVQNGTMKYIDQTKTGNGYEQNLSVDGELTVQTAGSGFHGRWDFTNPFSDGLPVSGHGIGGEIGGILYDDRAALTINIQDLGVLFWVSDVHEVTYRIKKDDLDVYDIISGVEEADGDGKEAKLQIFNRDEDEYLTHENDELEPANGFVTLLPMNLNIGYVRTWDFEKLPRQGLRFLAEYATAGANYQQQLTPGPGRSFIPRLSIGGEAGTMRGYFPVRVGWILGGPERVASTVGVGFNFRYFSIHGAYKAVGFPLWYPRRGFELAGGLNVNWGMVVDSDKDGISDRDDKCPFKPEDKDAFQDEDGCPEPDNDMDGLLDPDDKCPVDAEDMDGFEDEDGCPDYDNDEDGVPDTLDNCPSDPEDKDNFEDEDGCPDPDNDADGVLDPDDKCPNLPEDIDSYEDEDGCPEYDNDKDGIPDSTDECIFEAEVFNGFKDKDGCPDSLAKPTEKETKALYTKLANINFKTGSAELTSSSYNALNFVVSFLRQYPHLRYEIQGHTDSRGDDEYNLLLSAARASSVRAYLLHQGIPDSNLIAIGYGETKPIASNKTAKGRAQNRRVAFKIIETVDEYNMLKKQEQIFLERVREAKIKGVDGR